MVVFIQIMVKLQLSNLMLKRCVASASVVTYNGAGSVFHYFTNSCDIILGIFIFPLLMEYYSKILLSSLCLLHVHLSLFPAWFSHIDDNNHIHAPRPRVSVRGHVYVRHVPQQCGPDGSLPVRAVHQRHM